MFIGHLLQMQAIRIKSQNVGVAPSRLDLV